MEKQYMNRKLFIELLSDSLSKYGANESEIEEYLHKFDDISDEDFEGEDITDEEIDLTAREILSLSAVESVRSSGSGDDGDLDLDELFADNPQNEGKDKFIQEFDFPEYEAVPEEMVVPENIGDVTGEGIKNVKKLKKTKAEKVRYRPKVQGSPLFWTLFVVTLPITLPIFAAICVLVGVLYIMVTALIAALAAITIGCIAAGTALSLIGIIYGIMAITKHQVPVGLYEIGVGVALGGVTMLVSVLLYNTAVCFAPKLYKYAKKLTVRIFTGISDLYYRVKKECAK